MERKKNVVGEVSKKEKKNRRTIIKKIIVEKKNLNISIIIIQLMIVV